MTEISEPIPVRDIGSTSRRKRGYRFSLEKPDKYNIIDVTVEYNEGGMNYATSTKQERGYYLHITPQTESERSISYTGFSGKYKLLKRVTRHSDKRLNEMWEFVKPQAEKIATAFHKEDNEGLFILIKELIE